MGILTEYNPDLALREFAEYSKGNRSADECIPKKLVSGKTYRFLKKGQRNYWLEGEIPLLITKGNQSLSKPIASIRILEAIHFLRNHEPWTKGTYKIVEVYTEKDTTIHFNGFAKI
jgi:hypothetical protein